MQAETELLKRDRILDAIARIAAHLMSDPSLDAALPAALQQAGEAVAADRVVVLEVSRTVRTVVSGQRAGLWNAPGVEPQMRAGEMAGTPEVAAFWEAFSQPWPPAQVLHGIPAPRCRARWRISEKA